MNSPRSWPPPTGSVRSAPPTRSTTSPTRPATRSAWPACRRSSTSTRTGPRSGSPAACGTASWRPRLHRAGWALPQPRLAAAHLDRGRVCHRHARLGRRATATSPRRWPALELVTAAGDSSAAPSTTRVRGAVVGARRARRGDAPDAATWCRRSRCPGGLRRPAGADQRRGASTSCSRPATASASSPTGRGRSLNQVWLKQVAGQAPAAAPVARRRRRPTARATRCPAMPTEPLHPAARRARTVVRAAAALPAGVHPERRRRAAVGVPGRPRPTRSRRWRRWPRSATGSRRCCTSASCAPSPPTTCG